MIIIILGDDILMPMSYCMYIASYFVIIIMPIYSYTLISDKYSIKAVKSYYRSIAVAISVVTLMVIYSTA